jgi:hypothetical protein
MQGSDQQADGACAGLRWVERWFGVCSGKDEKIGVLQSLSNGLPKGFQIFRDKNDWVRDPGG